MADGSQWDAEPDKQQEADAQQLLSSPVIDADEDGQNERLLEYTSDSNGKFLSNARDMAIEQAERIFRNEINPYEAKPNIKAARNRAGIMYTLLADDYFTLAKSSSEAQDVFVHKFEAEYKRELHRLSAIYEADSDELKVLLVSARRDRSKPLEYSNDRAVIRAYISLFPDVSACQELVDEILPRVHARVVLYQKFHNEFEPKEED